MTNFSDKISCNWTSSNCGESELRQLPRCSHLLIFPLSIGATCLSSADSHVCELPAHALPPRAARMTDSSVVSFSLWARVLRPSLRVVGGTWNNGMLTLAVPGIAWLPIEKLWLPLACELPCDWPARQALLIISLSFKKIFDRSRAHFQTRSH